MHSLRTRAGAGAPGYASGALEVAEAAAQKRRLRSPRKLAQGTRLLPYHRFAACSRLRSPRHEACQEGHSRRRIHELLPESDGQEERSPAAAAASPQQRLALRSGLGHLGAAACAGELDRCHPRRLLVAVRRAEGEGARRRRHEEGEGQRRDVGGRGGGAGGRGGSDGRDVGEQDDALGRGEAEGMVTERSKEAASAPTRTRALAHLRRHVERIGVVA